MRLNSNKKIYTPKSLLGIENCEPLAIKEGRCAFSENLLYSDGVLKKRNGWEEKYRFTDESGEGLTVYGIYKYMDDVIFHAGDRLYKNEMLILCQPLPRVRSYGFEWNDLLYIVSGGEIYIYDGENVTNIYDSGYAYIPTTVKNISPIHMESTEVPGESESIITPRRKNTLIGVSEGHSRYLLDGKLDRDEAVKVNVKILAKQGADTHYYAFESNASRLCVGDMAGIMGIDGDIASDLLSGEGVSVNLSSVSEIEFFFKTPIKVTEASLYAKSGTGVPRTRFFYGDTELHDTGTVGTESTIDLNTVLKDKVIDRIRIHGNYGVGLLNEIRIFGRRRYSGYVELSYNESSVEFLKGINHVSINDAFGMPLSLYTNEEGSAKSSNVIYFEAALNGATIINIGYNAKGDSDISSNIEVEYGVTDSEKLNFKIGELCKTDTGRTALALSDAESVCLSSFSEGLSYFPKSSRLKLGGITSLCMGENGELYVFSRDTSISVMLTENEGKLNYSLAGYSNQGGAVSHGASKTVNRDTISLSNEGIFGSAPDKKCRARRGEAIKGMIKDKENAIAVEHNGCYYLFADGVAYVADTRLKSYENNRLDSDFQYEWWRLNNIGATYAAEINGEIYIGREDGRVVLFGDRYSDIYYEHLQAGSYLFDKKEGDVSIIYLDKSLNACAYDKLLLSDCYKSICEIKGQSENESSLMLQLSPRDFLDVMGCIKIYPEMTVYLADSDGNTEKAVISDSDAFTYTVSIKKPQNIHTYTHILLKCDGEEYTLESENDYYLLLDSYGDPIKLYDKENAHLRLKKSTPVSVEYVSRPLLSNGEAKFLYGVEIELTGDSEGLTVIDYETDKTVGRRQLYSSGEFDLNRFAFGDLSFDASLKKKHYLRTFEHGFEYAVLRIKHSCACGLGIKSYGLIYS